jgi:MFS family permease
MLALSARSGALAERIGPRPQLTVGPLIAALGLLVLARIGAHPMWARDVLPGALLLGFGLVTFVAPLTATVMAAADPDHVSIASGVNNAVARAASLAGIAIVPVVSGLTIAATGGEITHAYRVALVIAAALVTVAAVVMRTGLVPRVPATHSARRTHCAVEGPPVQPDPAKCPVQSGRRPV